MKTKKADDFVKRALSLPKLRFAVVGSGTSWTLYEGADLPKAEADVGPGEQLIKVNCQRKSATQLQMAVIGAAAELKIVKDKVFQHQVGANPKGFLFKTVSAQEDGALGALEAEMDSALAETIGSLPAALRDELLPLYNEAKRFVEVGDSGQASAALARIKARLATRNDTPQQAAARQKLVGRLRGEMVEELARLTRDRREQLQGPFNDVLRLAQSGDVAQAIEAVARLERALAGGPAPSDAGKAAPKPLPKPPVRPQPQVQPDARTPAKPLPVPPQKPAVAAQPEAPDPQDDLARRAAQADQLEADSLKLDLMRDLRAIGGLKGGLQGNFNQELQAIAARIQNADTLPPAQALVLLRTLQAELDAVNDLAREMVRLGDTMSALRNMLPKRGEELWQRTLAAFNSKDAAQVAALQDEFDVLQQDIAAEGPPKAADAVDAILQSSEDDLLAMSPQDCAELMEHMLQGDPAAKDQHRAALAKLSKVLDLDPKFERRDRDRRNRVVAAMADPSSGLADARSRWDTLPNPRVGEDGKLDPASLDKLKALQKALEIQCKGLGIDPPPQIKLFSDPATKVTDQSKLGSGGFLNPADGHIYLNDLAASFRDDFDMALDIVIHENTHKYQEKLKKDVQTGKLKPGDPEYDQALLFLLNSPPDGYLENGDGYAEQPVERHAWRAGMEARQAFATDERDKAQLLLDRMAAWLPANPTATGVVTSIMDAIRSSLEVGTGKQIRETTQKCQASFDKVVALAAPKKPTDRTQENWDKAQKLAAEMQDWVESHAGAKGQLESRIQELTDAGKRGQMGRLLAKHQDAFDLMKAT